MAVVTVAADNARYDAMETTANTTNIGGGAGEGVEPDIVYQGSNSVSRKVTNGGFYTSTGTDRNVTTTGRRTWLCKTWLTNYSSLTTGGNIHEVRIGSGTSAYYRYTVGSPSVAYPSRGGWVILAIDPNIASHRSGTTGSPNLSSCNYFAAFATCSTSKSENLCLDAIDFGVGLYLTGGDGADADGDFQDFVADDEGDVTNGRFGYVTTSDGNISVLGRLIVGASSSSGTFTATATGFTDSGASVNFPDNLAAAGFSGLVFHLGNASTVVSLTRCSFSSLGDSTGEDTRAVFDIIGTSGSFTASSCTFRGFASLDLTSAAVLSSCNIIDSGQIDVGDGADISGSIVSASTAASAVLWNVASDPASELSDVSFSSAGTGHAIELGANTPSTIEFSNHSYSGYAGTDGSTGNEVLYNNSGKSITVSVTNGGDVPTVRNGAGASTTVEASVSLTITNIIAGSEVRIYRTSDNAELAGIENSGTSFTYNYSYTVDTPIKIIILNVNYKWLKLNTVSLTSSNQSIPVQQQFDRDYAND